jgi:hypothetical protein
MGGSATTSNTAGSNDNKDDHSQRQGNLQKNINKLKAKGATAESIAGLKAKKEKEAKQFKQNTQGIKDGKAYVANQIGLVEKKAGPMQYLQDGKTTGMYASKLIGTKGGGSFYGEEASKATNDYLRSIGEMGVEGKDGIFRGNNITAQGLKLKYGTSNSAMGSGDPSGIMTSTAISQPMFKSQQRMQGLITGGIALMGVPLAGAMFIENSKRKYSNYIKSFNNIQSGKTNFASSNQSASSKSKNDQTASNTKTVSVKPDTNTVVRDAETVARDLKNNRVFASLKSQGKRNLLETNKQTISGNMAST